MSWTPTDGLQRLLIASTRRHADAHRQILGRFPAPDSPDRHGRGIVETDAGANISGSGADAIGGIEAHPAEVLDMGLDPGVAGAVFLGLDPGPEVAADVARRYPVVARSGDEDMAMVLADARAP